MQVLQAQEPPSIGRIHPSCTALDAVRIALNSNLSFARVLAGNLKEAIRNGNLQRDGTACALDVALLGLDVAKGCQAIHKYNVIHGDLKPHNVLLTAAPDDERGWIGKIADFGLSVKIKRGEQHVSGIQHGTEGYVAPEVLQTRRMVKASDVYSFGIIMWELWHARLYYEEHRNAVKRMCASPAALLAFSCAAQPRACLNHQCALQRTCRLHHVLTHPCRSVFVTRHVCAASSLHAQRPQYYLSQPQALPAYSPRAARSAGGGRTSSSGPPSSGTARRSGSTWRASAGACAPKSAPTLIASSR